MMTDNEQQKIAKLQQILDEHGINGKVTICASGPRVTRYEICHAPKIKMKKLRKVKDYIQMELQSLPSRILTPIPGRAEAGIEVPNSNPEAVALQEILDSEQWKNSTVAILLPSAKIRLVNQLSSTLTALRISCLPEPMEQEKVPVSIP